MIKKIQMKKDVVKYILTMRKAAQDYPRMMLLIISIIQCLAHFHAFQAI